MKNTTSGLDSAIRAGQISKYLNEYKDHGYGYGDLNGAQLLMDYSYVHNILDASIKNGTFDRLSFSTRSGILTAYNIALGSYTQVTIFFQNVDLFIESVMKSGLIALQYAGKDYQAELNKLSNLQQKTRESEILLAKKIEEIKEIGEIHSRVFTSSIAIASIEQNSFDVVEKIKEIHEFIEIQKSDASSMTAAIKEIERDVEIKRLAITTFASNIDEHKTAIEGIESQAKKVVGQESKIKGLIDQAEIALQLNSAQGISGAFATQYKNASKGWILYGWPIAAFVFVAAAIYLTVALITETKIKDPKLEINPILIAYPWIIIVGRAVSVSICLSAAAFCARQYTKQKNIAEDYAYKSVLAKSIVAFTKEIRKVDEEKATEYLATVLAEIHKDPLRIKLTKADGLSTIDFNALADRVSAALKGQKNEG